MKDGCDLIFTLDGKMLMAHQAIIKVRCPMLLTKNVKKKYQKKGILNIEIDSSRFDFFSFKYFITFLYNSVVELFNLQPYGILKLICCVDMYLLQELSELLVDYLELCITIDNFFFLIKEANKYNMDHVMSACLDFAGSNFDSILEEREGVSAIGLELFYEIVYHVNSLKIPIRKFRMGKSLDLLANLKNTFIEDFKQIYNEKFHSEIIFRIQDTQILCHKAILQSQGRIYNILAERYHLTNEIILPHSYADMSVGSFETIIKYLYFGNEDLIDLLVAYEINDFVLEYQLPKLCGVTSKMISRSVDDGNVISTLNDIHKANLNNIVSERLEKDCSNYLAKDFATIDFSLLYSGEIHPEIALNILLFCQQQIKTGLWIHGEKPFQTTEEKIPNLIPESDTFTLSSS